MAFLTLFYDFYYINIQESARKPRRFFVMLYGI